jgi:hypothetical protein
LAINFIKSLDESVKDNHYLSKYAVNEIFITNLKKLQFETNMNEIKTMKFYDQLFSNCKIFLFSLKNDPGNILRRFFHIIMLFSSFDLCTKFFWIYLSDAANPESVQTSLAFALNTDDYRFLLNIESTKKHGVHHVQTGYFDVGLKKN